MPILQTRDLTFSFRKDQPVVRQLNLSVEPGTIYGFLGPNGAGKTTSIRLILGLLQPTDGSVELFGEDLSTNRTSIFQRTGALIEQPSLYLHLSGRQNLEIARRYTRTPASRIPEVLEMVGLTHAAGKNAKEYSLGMKQRLGLAMALLHRPELVILDEPTNGLDPTGIIEMRELVRQLSREWGTTIFVSSHLLSEVERMCTHVGIIHLGSLRFQGSLAELQEAQAGTRHLHFQTSDNQAAAGVLHAIYGLKYRDGEALTVPFQNREEVASINRRLVEAGLDVYELRVHHSDLEEMFLEMTR
ncbi:ABC transporter ATP-binding protein [Siphonobacter aquaeclarae]|jgi:ABC-type multidrug transport system ATPase subunit|uniref:ABC-2 type transport system ATP-binding protein n=1 Tax=Siphonobacter aquaeclarae TaxID=563176 RepID=A0A1G9KZ84_9BACT|nr:ABC transporter ATP-binding protein [Siphonobacter aquaeclarae]SDL55002.1 ABC-2 type transport system ATP-binding protein [Siphonobacter aquaeclarae]